MPEPIGEKNTITTAARVLLRVMQEPGRYKAPELARELGETPRRVQRILKQIEAAGWQVERHRQRLTVTLPHDLDS